MADYAALDVYLAGWSGPALADPTGRAVVVLDQGLDTGTARGLLGDVQPLVKRTHFCAAFELDHGTIAIEPDSEMVLGHSGIRVMGTARIYRVGRIEIAPQPEYVIGLGAIGTVKQKLASTLREVEVDLEFSDGALRADPVESIGDNTHVFRLKRNSNGDGWVGLAEPSVALKILELAEYVGGDAWFEVSSLQRFEGEVAAPFLDAQSIDGQSTDQDGSDYWMDYSELVGQDVPPYPDPEADSITIAVVDGYFEIDHPAVNWAHRGLNTLAWPMRGKDAHGTACAGVAAARAIPQESVEGREELRGGVGGAFPGAKVLPVRVYDPAVGAHDELALARGIVGAVKMGASVISISLAQQAQTSTVVKAAIEFAEKYGRVVVAAAGNPRDGDDDYRVWYPARYPTVIAVGAAHSGEGPLERVVGAQPVGPASPGAVRWSSAYGPELDVVAPGQDVATLDLQGLAGQSETDYWLKFAGTSAAAPVVAGVAARFLHENRSASPADVRDRIAQEAARPPAVASPGFNVMRPTELGSSRRFSEQLGYGLIERTTKLTPDAPTPTS